MIRHTTVACIGILLACCDKSRSPNENGSEASAVGSRHKAADRQHPPDEVISREEALKSALAIESRTERDKALADVAWSVIETNPELAHEAFHRLSADSPEKIRLIQHYAVRLAEPDVDEALEWAKSLETELERAAAIGQIALALAETDPQRAANLLSESGIEGRDFDVAVVQVIQRWAAKSAPDAAAWVSVFPPGQAREASLKVIAAQWIPRDASAAFDWFDSLKDGQLRRETARAMEGILLQQPESIRDAWLQLADPGIQSELEQQRDKAMEDVGDNIPSPNR